MGERPYSCEVERPEGDAQRPRGALSNARTIEGGQNYKSFSMSFAMASGLVVGAYCLVRV
jgi:hypothetical protein